MAAYVDASAIIRTRLGPERIERFVLDAGVPFHVALRVLMAGGPRRPCARFHEPAHRAGRGDDGSAASSAYFRVPMASAADAWGVNRRVDGQTALLIDAAVSAATSHGVAGAAAELIDLGLPVECVFRVLCNPGLRRRYLLPMSLAKSLPVCGEAGVCRRRNRLQAAYVNAALTISKVVSVQRAEAILAEQGVPQRVIVRVLYLNGLRRNHGGAAMDTAALDLRPATACNPPRAPS